MRNTTAQQLRAVAPQILSGQITGDEPFCPDVVKRAIAILDILKDREWHTARDVGEQLGLTAKYTRDLIATCAESWELESHRRNGFKLNHHVCPRCSSIYYPDADGWHECECGWWWQNDTEQ